MNNFYKDKSVFITGGAGSLGMVIVKKLLEYNTKKIIIFSRDELKHHQMQQEGFTQDNLRYFIGDIREKERLERALDGVDIIIHTAALKQVPSCEYNPFEAVKTNILGAQNIINAAIDKGVKKVMAVSTDKAVNPVNLYGATKLCAEKIFVQGNSYSGYHDTHFSCIRLGNIISTSGSVLSIFKKQKKDGILTITDKNMTRFWVDFEKGVNFILKYTEMMRGGEIFIPKMSSMKIVDLAYTVAPGCKFKIIGIRPGEKIHEDLITEDESRHTLEFKEFYVIEPEFHWWVSESWKNGKRLSQDFRYTSNLNKEWLSQSEIAKLIDGVA